MSFELMPDEEAVAVRDDRGGPYPYQQEAMKIASELLVRFVFDGGTREWLERIAAGREDDDDQRDWMEDLRDAKEREEALRR
jgi:hypothetical protein